MIVKNSVLKVLGHVIRQKTRKRREQFLNTCLDSQAAQADTLRRILALNEDSHFSREHGLTSSLKEQAFRKQFPISEYDRFADHIERVKQGETEALLGPENELLMFALSSGTTSASKFIPITKPFLEDYRRGWTVWGIQAVDSHPGLDRGYILQVSSHPNRFQTPGGTPCGNISGLVASMQSWLIRFLYAMPPEINSVDHPEGKYYAITRLMTANSRISWITTANPGTLVKLASMMHEHREQLVREIHDGTIRSPYPLSDSEVKQLRSRHMKPNRERAKELEKIIERTGTLLPRDCFPILKLLAVWTGGAAGAYLPTLRELFGDIPIRDHGLSASEGRMTIPFEAEASHGLLDVTSHFFEFIPVAEIDSANPITLLPHELEEGQEYFILMTTPSGLYRYDIHDVVRCVDFYGTTPILEFLHKGAHISNITGEKLAESQIVQAVREGAESIGVRLPRFSVAPSWSDPPQYRLLVEQSELPESDLSERLAKAVDDRLKELNCEYEEKRGTMRLDQLALQSVPDGTWDALARQRNSKVGSSVEQYKHPYLIPDLQFLENLSPKSDISAKV